MEWIQDICKFGTYTIREDLARIQLGPITRHSYRSPSGTWHWTAGALIGNEIADRLERVYHSRVADGWTQITWQGHNQATASVAVNSKGLCRGVSAILDASNCRPAWSPIDVPYVMDALREFGFYRFAPETCADCDREPKHYHQMTHRLLCDRHRVGLTKYIDNYLMRAGYNLGLCYREARRRKAAGNEQIREERARVKQEVFAFTYGSGVVESRFEKAFTTMETRRAAKMSTFGTDTGRAKCTPMCTPFPVETFQGTACQECAERPAAMTRESLCGSRDCAYRDARRRELGQQSAVKQAPDHQPHQPLVACQGTHPEDLP